MHKLSRESLIKLVNLIPLYLEKDILKLIDDKISTLENEGDIEISNLRISDLKKELEKKRFSLIIDFIDFKIYEYEKFTDVYFTGTEICCNSLIAKLKKNIKCEDFTVMQITSRSLKTPYLLETKQENIWDNVKLALEKQKKIETAKIRLFRNHLNTPQRLKRETKNKTDTFRSNKHKNS